MAEISLDRALAEAKAIKHHYKAFERLGEVISAAIAADRQLRADRRSLKAIGEEIESATAKRNKLKDEIGKFESALVKETEEAEKAHASSMRELGKKGKAKIAAYKSHLVEIEKKEEARKAAYIEAAKERERGLKSLDDRVSAARSALDSLKSGLAVVA